MESSADRTLPCSSLILAVGDNATGFLSAFILSSGSWEVAGYIKLWNERCRAHIPESDATNSPSSCTFYRSVTDPAVMLCLCKSYVAEDQQFQWCEKVFSCLQKSGLKVTVLSTCPVTDYKTTESTHHLPVPFLRVVTTKPYTDRTPCGYLEQPNIVDGLPAAVMAHCQVWGIPAAFYQCYTDITKLDSVTMEAFRPVLSCQSMSRLAANSCLVPPANIRINGQLGITVPLVNTVCLILSALIGKDTPLTGGMKSEKIEEVLKKTLTTNEVQSNLYI